MHAATSKVEKLAHGSSCKLKFVHANTKLHLGKAVWGSDVKLAVFEPEVDVHVVFDGPLEKFDDRRLLRVGRRQFLFVVDPELKFEISPTEKYARVLHILSVYVCACLCASPILRVANVSPGVPISVCMSKMYLRVSFKSPFLSCIFILTDCLEVEV